MPPFTKKSDGIVLKVYVQPKSSSNAIVGIHDDALKIRLTAPPVDGAANQLCIKFLAKSLGIPKSSLEILSGHASRFKQVLIRTPDSSDDALDIIVKEIKNLIPSKNP